MALVWTAGIELDGGRKCVKLKEEHKKEEEKRKTDEMTKKSSLSGLRKANFSVAILVKLPGRATRQLGHGGPLSYSNRY